MNLSPVAIFVYNRLDKTKKTIEHFLRNTLAKETDVYVFSDGGKNEESWNQVNAVRSYLHDLKQHHGFKSLTLVERMENIYLEKNITTGIQQVFQNHDRIIVLEDDICTSPYYLQYMNDVFEAYQDVPEVMHISGFTNLAIAEPFYFTPHMSGWGWGTWKNRWEKHFHHYKTREEALQGMTAEDEDRMQYGGVFPCLKSLDKDPIPWDICWEIAIYKAKGLCFTPGHTMVRNIGLKNGTHFRSFDVIQYYEFDREPWQNPVKIERIAHPEANPKLEALFAEAIRDWGIRYTVLGRILRFFYKKLVKKA